MTCHQYTLVDELLQVEATPPKVYLAGKIRKNCWRHLLVNGLREHNWDLGPLKQKEFLYIGPFFVGCDHGCYHMPGQHGGGKGCASEHDMTRYKVAARCRRAVDHADLVFCYIDSVDCYGTIAEIERASMQGIRVVIAFAPGIASSMHNDFWFVCTNAHQVFYNIHLEELPELFDNTLRGLP